MQKELDNWFASWFNTPYYHTLYKDRDYKEASLFMDNLTSYLKLTKESKILDLACGKGRHAIYLHSIGYTVTGVDLSKKSIAYAKQFERPGLTFHVHDMCEPFQDKFDAVFNLFTSFGYFEDPNDNLRTIKAIKSDLKPDGLGVIDFMNVNYVLNTMVAEETKIIDGLEFNINKRLENGYIIKDIRFKDNNTPYHFTEKVKALTQDDFLEYFKHAQVEVQHCFGDYKLQPFNVETSDRLILIFK